jgi:hypothetical protein
LSPPAPPRTKCVAAQHASAYRRAMHRPQQTTTPDLSGALLLL